MMNTTASIKSPAVAEPNGYASIDARLLDRFDKAPASYYLSGSSRTSPSLLCRAGSEFTPKHRAQVTGSPTGRALLKECDYRSLCEQLLKQSDQVLLDPSLCQAERFTVLLAATAGEADRAIGLIKPDRLIGVCKRVAHGVTQLLNVGQVSPTALLHAARYGSPWFAHSASVACYSVLLAVAMEIQDAADLHAIAVGGMLHDLGLWKAEGRELSQAGERFSAPVAQHPAAGYEELLDDPEINRRQLMMVYQHHESPNGTGYPVGVLADEIDPWAALLKVVDTFDHLSTVAANPLRRKLGITLERINDQAGETLDAEAVRCWIPVITTA